MRQTIPLRELAKVANLTDVLTFRPNAAKMYAAAMSQLPPLNPGTVLEVDFRNILVCDASFVDEFVIKMQLELLKSDNIVMLLVNCNHDVLLNVEAALTLRNEKSKLKIVLLVYTNDGYKIMGRMEQSLRDTFDMIVKRGGSITAREIAEIFDLPEINGASNRLRRLYDARIVFRQQDNTRWQQVYRLPTV